MSNEPVRGSRSSWSDLQLVEAVRRGDVDAFEPLVKRYERKIYNMAYRFLGDEEEALDLSQEVFLKAYRSLERFRGEARFSTWLHRIAVNTAINRRQRWFRRRRFQQLSLESPPSEDEPPLADLLPHAGAGPEEGALRREQAEAIQAAIAALSPSHRAIVILRDVEGHSYEEIAQILGLSLGTVKSRLNRARKKLQRALAHLL